MTLVEHFEPDVEPVIKPPSRRRRAARCVGRAVQRWWRSARRRWRNWFAPAYVPQPKRIRRLASARQWATYAFVAACGLVTIGPHLPIVGSHLGGGDDNVAAPAAPAELDRGAAAGRFAEVSFSDNEGFGRNVTALQWPQEGSNYWRVVLDRRDAGGCVQVGVVLLPDGFAYTGPGAPIGCPAARLAAVVEGKAVFGDEPIRVFAVRFVDEWMAGRDVSLFAAAGVELDPPAPASKWTIDRVTKRDVDESVQDDGPWDVTVFGSSVAAGKTTRMALRLTVRSRGATFEVTAARGGLTALVGQATTPLPIPPVTAPAPATTTTTAAPAATTTTVRPPVTVAPTATTTATSQPAAPTGAGA